MSVQPCLQFLLENGNRGRLLRRQIDLFLGIGRQVVQFRLGRVDVMVSACFEGMQWTPPKRTKGIESLAVAPLFGLGSSANQPLGLELFLNRVLDSCDPYQGRSDRNRFYRLGNPARPNAAPSRRFNDQRHMDRGVVNKKTVLMFAVFTQ